MTVESASSSSVPRGQSLRRIISRLRLAFDQRLPDRPVRRRVRGVDILLPRRHGLPFFMLPGSPYAENLVTLARLLHEAEGDLCLLDVGANVGDSVLLVLDQVPASAVCVEPDPEWRRYLEFNAVGRDIAVEGSVLLGSESEAVGPLAMVHHAVGTSQVTQAEEDEGLVAITVPELLRRHPRLAGVRLVKTDTDGYDVMLVPELVRTFLPSRPVVFFEFDPRPTRLATPELDPGALWGFLVDQGYEQAVVWDNSGRLLGAAPTAELAGKSAVLELPQQQRGYGFWDVAVAHRDDEVGLGVLEAVGAGQLL